MPVYDALPASNLRHILVRHEQAAAFAADAWARATGKVGVCLATSGPGCDQPDHRHRQRLSRQRGDGGDHRPGGDHRDGFGRVPGGRHILGMTLAVVKHSWSVRDAADIPHVVAEAFRVAKSGRPGPVLIDLPKDVAAARIDRPSAERPAPPAPKPFDPATLHAAQAAIARATKPLLYVGGRRRHLRRGGAAARLCRTNRHPVRRHAEGVGRAPHRSSAPPGNAGDARVRARPTRRCRRATC